MGDIAIENLSEEAKLAREYYAKLDQFASQCQLRTSIGYPNSRLADKELLRKYLEFRGWKLRKRTSLEHLALLILEQDTKDEKVRCGLSLFVKELNKE